MVCRHLTQMLFSWWLGRWSFQSCSIPIVKYCNIIYYSFLLCSYYFCNSFEENSVWEELYFCEICIYLYIPLSWTFWYMYFNLSKVFYLVSESSSVSSSEQSQGEGWTLTLSEQTWKVCRKYDMFSNNYNTAGKWQLCQEMQGEPWTSADEPQSLLRRTQRILME